MASREGFSGPDQTIGAALTPVRPPIHWLVIALGVLVVSAFLLKSDGYNDGAHLLGWALASLGSVGCLAVFTASDLKRRQNTSYSPVDMASKARVLVGATAIILAGWHAWILAYSLAAR